MATESAQVPDSYADLLTRYRRLTYLNDAGQYLSWDQQVMMPDAGTPGRGKQLSALSAASHELLTDDAFRAALEGAEAADLTADQEVVVREIRRQYDRAAKVPTDLVERISEETSKALPVWKEAKAESDWEAFAPQVETLLELKREYAHYIDPDADPYEVLFADYEPYLPLSTAEEVLETLRDALVPLIESVRESDVTLAHPFEDEYDDETQLALCEAALDLLGYPEDRGRLDTAPHPFSTGTQFDSRITTRFKPADPMDALTATIHEFGHATYTLGLPQSEYGTPLGEHRGLTVHESQSRLWENHVGRSRAFWDRFADTFTEYIDVDADARDLYEAANQIYPNNMIRVEADELTYHLHIILRFEIERDLIAGDLAVADVPEAWNAKMQEYLGITPENDAEGCLQDIHWSHGSFGYFPTYSLGSVLAAQLYAAAEGDIDDLDGKVRAGEFEDLHAWLTENVHAHGARYTTDELIEEATGEGYSAEHLVEYVTSKFGDLYDL
jgi:carboxypeptidase Taq